MHDTLKALRDGTPPSKLQGVADAELMKRVTQDADYTKWTKEFWAATTSIARYFIAQGSLDTDVA